MNGLLLVNLGTPDAPKTPEVRRYLREFLSDPRVLDMSAFGRWSLLNFAILPTRPAKSAEAYQKIWGERGSPLLYHSNDLAALVGDTLGSSWKVELAMRYGRPSIDEALDRFRADGIDDLLVFPLYPHYAASSTGSTLEAVMSKVAARWNVPRVTVVPPFYDDAAFIRSFVTIGKPVLDQLKPDHVLLSYHGLPERHMQKSHEDGKGCTKACTEAIVPTNRHCYRAQCYATTRALRAELGLTEDNCTVAFQSRLGKDPWIQPFTDVVLPELAKQGKKKIAVFCPAFVADCLETLEEIGIRAKADFKAAGGEDLVLVPSLNAHPAWVDTVVGMVRRFSSW